MQGLEEEGGPDDGFALGGDVGAMVSACVRAVRVSGRLKEGRGAGKRGLRDNDTACERATGQGTDEAGPLGREGEGERASGARRSQVGPTCQWTGRPRREGGWALFLLLFLNFYSFFLLFFFF